LIERHRPEVFELVPKLLDDDRELTCLQATDDEHSQPGKREQQRRQRRE
jgi:hypothetical protein